VVSDGDFVAGIAIRTKVALVYTVDSRWRNRAEFVNGRADIVAFLRRK
jgi:nuclear transport factor 2 (NTF2) superfamily protein